MSKSFKVIQMLPEMTAGGVECTVKELALAVAKTGGESIVISGGGAMVDDLQKQGIRHIQLPVGRKSWRSFLLISQMRELFEQEKPDIVHVHSRVPAWIGYLAWKGMPSGSRPHLVSTVHGFYSVNFYSHIMTCGERVITVSESAKEYVLKNYPDVSSDKVKAIPLGVDTKEYYPSFKPDEDWVKRWYQEFPELQGKWILCLPGRLTRIKGHEDFLEIIQKLKEDGLPVHGLIVGDAHPRKKEYAIELKKKVSIKGLSGFVTFTGHRSDLREVLSISDVVLSLTKKPESFGRTTLEALALGKPTLGYSYGGVKEQLDVFLPEGNIEPHNIEAVRQRLKSWYVQLPNLPKVVLSPFRLENMTEGNLSVYRELLHES